MSRKLPGWVVSNRESVEREAAPYRSLTPEQRAQHLAAACRTSAALLDARPDRERVLAYVDPLPESTRRALARLREQYRRAGRS